MSPPKHTLFTFRTKVCVQYGCPSWKLVIQAHTSWLSKKPSSTNILQYVPDVAHGYCVKLQHHKYTEWRTPDNNIWKIPIWLTSVGLAHARPNYQGYLQVMLTTTEKNEKVTNYTVKLQVEVVMNWF